MRERSDEAYHELPRSDGTAGQTQDPFDGHSVSGKCVLHSPSSNNLIPVNLFAGICRGILRLWTYFQPASVKQSSENPFLRLQTSHPSRARRSFHPSTRNHPDFFVPWVSDSRKVTNIPHTLPRTLHPHSHFATLPCHPAPFHFPTKHCRLAGWIGMQTVHVFLSRLRHRRFVCTYTSQQTFCVRDRAANGRRHLVPRVTSGRHASGVEPEMPG